MRRQCSNGLRFRDIKKRKEKLKEGRKSGADKKACSRMAQKRTEEEKTDKFRYRQ